MLMMEFLGNVHFYSSIDGEKYSAKEKGFLIPVYGDIPCGPPNFVDDEIKGYLEIPEDMIGDGEYFVLRAKGDSMTDAGIVAGDLVVVKKQNYAEESQIVVAFIDGETTLKRIYKGNIKGLIELRPENKRYKTIYTSDCVILGVAVKIIKDIR